jgi:hypothetical protein
MMKKILLFLGFVLLFTFSYTQASDKDLLYQKHRADTAFEELEEDFGSRVLLKACAFGSTSQNAKISALKALSQQIVAQVKAEEKLYKKREKGKVSRSYVSSSTIFTQSLLQGVKFKDFGRKPEGYKVCAYFTEKSLKETIGYLKSALSIDLKKLNRKQLKEALTKAQFMLNLAFLSPKEKEIIQFAQAKIEEINTYLNYGCLVINTIPETAKIIINQKVYPAGKPIYLPPEVNYVVKIVAPGYREVIKNVYLARGEKKSLSVELVKEIKGGVTVYVSANEPFLIDEAKSLLTSAGFKISSLPLATNAFYIKLKDDKVQVGEYTKHVLTMYVTAYRGEEEFASVRGRIKGFFTTPETEEVLVKKKAGRLLRAVFKRLLNRLDVEKFRGEDKFDYSALLGGGQVKK